MPLAGEVSLLDLGFIPPNVLWVEIEHGPRSYRYRRIGVELERICVSSIEGLYIDEVPGFLYRRIASRAYAEVVGCREPVCRTLSFSMTSWFAEYEWRRPPAPPMASGSTSAFSETMVDRIIDRAKPASGGADSSVGFYDHREIVALVVALSEASGIPVPDLIKAFGRHPFGRFATVFPALFENVPDVELPVFLCDDSRSGIPVLDHKSKRPFADLAE